eukprot:m.186775 g.186775  ORF g.186775 m.186775 type:complete len:1305 (-) comp32280_c0_seq1:186-4100(-)
MSDDDVDVRSDSYRTSTVHPAEQQTVVKLTKDVGFVEDPDAVVEPLESDTLKDADVDDGKKKKKKDEPVETVPFKQLFRFASGFDKFLILLGTLGAVAHGAMFPLMIIFFGDVLENFGSNDVFNGTTDDTIVNTSATFDLDDGLEGVRNASTYMLYVAVASGFGAWVQLTCFMRAAQRQSIAIRREYFRALLRQEVGWYDAQLTGHLTSRIAADVALIQDALGDKLGAVIQFMTMFLAGIIIAFVYSWKLTLVILSLAPFMAVGGALFGKMLEKFTTMGQKEYAEAGGIADEVLTLIRTVVAFDTAELEVTRYTKLVTLAKVQGAKMGRMMGLGTGYTFFIIFCMYALSFYYGSILVSDNEISTGAVVIAFFSVMVGSMGIGQAAVPGASIAKGKGAAFGVYKILDRVPEIDSLSVEGSHPKGVVGNIEFKDVDFSYPTRPDEPVFTKFNLKVNAGQTVAIVGESGCGKSTIANLCLRFYDSISGSISLDGVDLKDLNIQWLRNNVGLVSQQPALFPGSIRDNIAAGKPGATDADIERAARAANAHTFISEFTDKYATNVGDAGTQLSGGQKQRIAIARALIKEPKILVLDEATSALDTLSEKIVQDALEKARSDRTTIVIAHRLSTVRDCDDIIVVGNGGIRERGTHAELMEKQGVYYAMHAAQQMSDGMQAKEDEALREVSGKSTGSGVRVEVTPSGLGKSEEAEEYDDKEDLEKLPIAGRELRWAARFSKGLRCQTLVGSLFCLVEGGGYVAWPIMLSRVTVELMGPNDTDKIRLWSIYFIILGISLWVAMVLKFTLLGNVGEELTLRLRTLSFRNLLHKEVSWFDHPANAKGRLTSQLAHDAAKIRGLVGDTFGAVLQIVSMLVIGITLAIYFCWEIGLLVIACFPIIAAATSIQQAMFLGFSEFSGYEASGMYATHAIENIRTVLAMGKVEYYHEIYMRELNKVTPKIAKTAYTTGVVFGLVEFIMIALWGGNFYFGAYLIKEDRCTFMGMYDALLVILFPAMMIGNVAKALPDKNEALAACRRIYRFIGEDGTGYNEGDAKTLANVTSTPTIFGKIEFQNVSFTYPSRPDVKVLENLSFQINAGETVAFVGASGCGKSTVMALLEQFYRPDSGTILLDGVPIQNIEPSHFRSNIGYVAQEPQLFSMTIRENIAYGINESEVTTDVIMQAARNANAHNFVSAFKKGYDTTVGEKGLKLSGGQRQRVAIARALVRTDQIKLLLLDEATSALDSKSEEIVQAQLDELMKTRTTLMISHRLSTSQNADRILVFDDGKIIEQGTHTGLIEQGGAYAKMVAAQS